MTENPAAQIRPTVFIGSSSEALAVCKNLQSELEKSVECEATVWDQDVFLPSTYTLESLATAAAKSDFAVLVITPDDLVSSRDVTALAPRDNVIFELGLFVGALGRERTYIVSERGRKIRLPSDLLGVTYLSFERRRDDNLRASLNDAVLGISGRIRSLGKRSRDVTSMAEVGGAAQLLDGEIDLICRAALAQGWKVRTRSAHTLRLDSPRGRRHTLSLGQSHTARLELREFAKQLRADGLRVNRSVRNAVTSTEY